MMGSVDRNEWKPDEDEGLLRCMSLEGGDEVRVEWKGEWRDAEYLAPYLKDIDLGVAILVMVIDDTPGLRREDNLVCVPDGDGWKGLFPVK